MFIKNSSPWSSLVAQQVKDPVLSLLHLGSLLWHRLHPWPGIPHAAGTAKKKKTPIPDVEILIQVFKLTT